MKTTKTLKQVLLPCITLICLLLLGACTSVDQRAEGIHVGMTKSQVLQAWGSPSGKQYTSHGEVWVYGGERWLRALPYIGPFVHVQTQKAVFSPGGRLLDFRATDEGDMMSAAEGMGGSRLTGW